MPGCIQRGQCFIVQATIIHATCPRRRCAEAAVADETHAEGWGSQRMDAGIHGIQSIHPLRLPRMVCAFTCYNLSIQQHSSADDDLHVSPGNATNRYNTERKSLSLQSPAM